MNKRFKIKVKHLSSLLKKRVKKMATTSFDRQIVIKDEKAFNVLMNGLEKSNESMTHSKVDVEQEFRRGRSVLRNFSSRSKKSY